MIDIRNVRVVYPNGQVALDNFSVHVEQGEFVVVVGSSGAGKSTFFRLINHEIEPSDGDVYINGQNLRRLRKSRVPYYRRQLGVVFQDFRLLPNKTVFENVAFALEVIGVPRKEIRQRVAAILDMVGLSHKTKDMPHNLSGGEQQRVAIARAIVNRPQVLIADEPTGNLDPETSRGIMDLFKDINHQGTTIVMVTHDMDMVSYVNKRVITIAEGRVAKEETRGVETAR